MLRKDLWGTGVAVEAIITSPMAIGVSRMMVGASSMQVVPARHGGLATGSRSHDIETGLTSPDPEKKRVRQSPWALEMREKTKE